MRTSILIRQVLHRAPNTSRKVSELAERTGATQTAVCTALRRMPDTYIHEWLMGESGKYVAGWRVVVPPQDAPKPCKKN